MNKLDYAVVFVADMPRSVRFYRDILGLPLRFESPKWTEFATEGCTVALHWTDRRQAEVGALPSPAGQCQLGFKVPDLDAFHRDMLAKGVACLQPPELEAFGTRLALYADPDGLPISVVEAAAHG